MIGEKFKRNPKFLDETSQKGDKEEDISLDLKSINDQGPTPVPNSDIERKDSVISSFPMKKDGSGIDWDKVPDVIRNPRKNDEPKIHKV